MPFCVISLIFRAGMRAVILATHAWWELFMAIVGFHMKLCWKAMVWMLALFALPIRVCTALYRQSKLEEQLHDMKTRLDNFDGENKVLGQLLLLAINERKVVEAVFEEMELEHEKALSKNNLLENEVQNLKEKLQIYEARGKILWDWKTSDINSGSLQAINAGISPWRHESKEGSLLPQDMPMHGYQEEVGSSCPFLPDSMLEGRKLVACQRSLFSVLLSFLVGLVMWEAEDVCMPLAAALVTVVGMSLSSVVQFFFVVRNKPALAAVALLSLNCFMLGTLTCPILPSFARAVS